MRKYARLQLECLETREVLSANVVSYHGGGVLPNVEVQGVYLGSQWSSNSTLNSQAGYLEGFLKSTVSGSYMDMLSQAGYGVHRGTATRGEIDNMTLNSGSTLSDSQIQSQLTSLIKGGYLASPDTNRVYMVFVPPNVEVTNGSSNSQGFAGYHSAFTYHGSAGQSITIHYAVVDTPGGTTNNGASNPYLSTLAEMTVVVTHELTETVTDPNGPIGRPGWYAPNAGGQEIGDLANGIAVTLNGYEVQAEVNQHGQLITPSGSTNIIYP